MKKTKRSKKSRTWVIKQHRDQFFKKSKTLGYRSRSAFKLIELIKKMRYIFGDDKVLDKSLIADDIEDIYLYIIEKAYERSDYIFEELNFKDNAKQKLLVAFNKFFFDKFTI